MNESQILQEKQKEELVTKIINWICVDDRNKQEVVTLIHANTPVPLTLSDVQELLNKAFEIISSSIQSQRSEIVNEHVKMYEQIYNYFESIGYPEGCNKALQAKERLLNVVKDQNKLRLERKETIIHTSTEPQYDHSQLTEVERSRLKELLLKASTDKTELLLCMD